MEHRDQAMSLMNRPDERNERRREEARRARANQARPLVEPETTQVFQGDSTFSRVTVPVNQLDDFTKSIMEVLGPYHNLLGGPTINGPRALKRSTTVEGDGKLDAVTGSDPASSSSSQQQLPLNPRQSSSSTNAKHVNSLPGGDSRHPSSLPLSHSSSSSSSVIALKPAKPTLLTPVESSSLTSTSQTVVTLPSSPTTLPQSPGRSGVSKDLHMAPKDSDGHKEVKLTSHPQTPSASSLSLKHKIPPKSSRSPRKDASNQQAPAYSHSSSKSRLLTQSSSTLGATEHMKLVSPIPVHNPAQLFHSSFSKDHSSSNNNNNPFKTINTSSAALPPPVTSSSAAAAGNGRPSPSASIASMSHISPSNQIKTDLSPPVRPKSSFSDRTHIIPSPRPRSATPTKIKPHMPNGITSQHTKLSPAESSSTHALSAKAASASSSTDKVDKTKSLKLCMPHEKKIPTTKSDLIDIFKEMAEVHAPLTDIETPQKVDGQFPFYASRSSPDGKRNIDFSTGLLSAKEDTKKLSASEASKAGKENQKIATSQNEATLSSTPVCEAAVVTKEVKVEEKPSVEPAVKEELSVKVKNAPTAAEPVRYSGSSVSHAPRHRSIGKTMSDDNSILMRDLDLSEDSDVEQASEDNVSECQSKKGKVITASAGVAVKRAVSPMSTSSSSSSSSSGSDSESGGDDDTDNEGDEDGDDDGKEKTKERDVEVKKSSERRLSSSSSSSSSESDLGSEGEEGDGEDKEPEGKKAEHMEIRPAAERGDKTPSPAYKQAAIMKASLDTPSKLVPENSDASLSWRLDNFMKKSSPAGISPLKSAASPPTSHSAPPSVQPKDEVTAKTPDQNRPKTLKDLNHCDTISFEVQARKVPGSGGDMAEDDDDDDDSEMFSVIKSSVLSKKDCDSLLGLKTSTSSKQSVHRRSALSTEENSRKVTAKEDGILPSQKFVDPLRTDSVRGLKSSSSSFKKELKRSDSPAGVPAESTKTPSPLAKPKPVQPGSGSSSNDEIDVVNVTPDEKFRNRLSSSEKPTSKRGLLESSKVRYNGTLSESSDKDTQASPHRGKTVEKTHSKHHKTKEPLVGHASTSVSLLSTSRSADSSNALVASTKTTKKDSTMALDHLDAISKPPNLLSPLHSAYSSPPISSTRPLPPFHSSFPLHSSPSVMPPYVSLTRNADGTSRPKIVVQIRSSFLSKKVLSWVKEKRERRRKFNMETRVSESSKADEITWDNAKGSKIPSNRSSVTNREGDTVGVPKNGEPSATSPTPTSSAHSMSSQPPRLGKNKSRDSSTSGGDALSSPHSKMPKYANSSNKEPHSSASSSSSSLLESSQNTHANKGSSSVVDVSSCAAVVAAVTSPRARVAKRPPSSEQTSPSKVINSSAVKTLDFVEDRDINSDQSKSDKTKTFKRKMDISDETAKKSKPDQPGDKGNSSAPAAIGKRRDSTNSTSSKGSHQSASSAKKPRRISGNSKKDSSNNNSIEKASAPITNGPESSNLPFNHYVNGNGGSNGSVSSRTPSSSTPAALPANIPPPSPVETQLHSTKHYLARAREHKHHADNLKDKLAKFEPYLRSGLSFYLAGYSMELSHRELGTSYKMYNDTYGLLQYVVKMRANSSSNPDSSDRERKLIVLIIRLQAFLNHRMFRLRQAEVSKLKKVIESEQAKLHPSSTPSTTASSSTSANQAASTKPLAPSPHQAHWNKNSTGTPSPMSPTPSPAGSVSSQGSCELVNNKIQNGATSSSSTPLASPSPGMVSVHPRLHAVNQKYFVLTSHTVKSWELWDQADAESKGSEDFFTVLDNACGPLSFHLDPPVVVRYMKHALRLLNL